MQVVFINQEGQVQIGLSLAEISQVLAEGQGVLWLDLMEADVNGAPESILTTTFGFHPLAVDDALNETHVPKLDDWETYLYLVLQDAAYQHETRNLVLPELDVFLGGNYLVTYHVDAVTAVDRVWSACQRDKRRLQHGADHLLYQILDEMVNDYVAVFDMVEDVLGQLEAEVFDNPEAELLETLFAYKRISRQLRRVLGPQREVVNKLARDMYSMIGPKDRLYFRDVYDHMISLHDLSDSLRDRVMGNLDIYLSVVNNRMNDIMKTLTVITTLFMPLSFITGFFGMNFFEPVFALNAWTGPAMFTAVMCIMLLLPLGMFWWMRRRAWM